MRILFTTRRLPGVGAEQLAACRLDEVAAVWRLVKDGFVRDIWFSPERPAVIGIVEADSVDQARDRLRALPMAQRQLIDFELSTLTPYDQFELLFTPPARP